MPGAPSQAKGYARAYISHPLDIEELMTLVDKNLPWVVSQGWRPKAGLHFSSKARARGVRV